MAMMATRTPVESPSPLVPSPSVLLSVLQVGAWDTCAHIGYTLHAWIAYHRYRYRYRCMHAGHNVEGGALPLLHLTGGVITR